MKVLIDECLPRRLTNALVGHEARTVQQMGWSRKSNGELLALMAGQFHVFVTIDSNIIFQQNLTNLPVALVVLRAKSNKFEDVEPLVPAILTALVSIRKGDVIRIP